MSGEGKMATVIALEAWTVPTEGDEEYTPLEMVEQAEFGIARNALDWAWEKMHQGFFVRLYVYHRREPKGKGG
jgi:hypothetical protein